MGNVAKGAAVAALLLASAAGGDEKASLIQGTAGASAGSLEVRAGGLVVREGAAGSAFGTVRAGGKRRLSYFVVFKHSFSANAAADCKEEASAEDNGGTSRQTIDLDGKKLTVDYKVSYDPKAKKVLAEGLTVGGKKVDVAKGRVFVVDLTAAPPKWEQKKLELPADVPDTRDGKAAEALAKKVLAGLAKQDKKVQALLDAAGGGR